MVVALSGGVLTWLLFGGRVVASAIEEAGTEALGAVVDVGAVDIRERRAAIELRGLAIADPFDRTRNLFEAASVHVELEPEPLLERKVVIKRLTVRDARTGTRRATPAPPVDADGFAPRALAELDRWSKRFKVPLLALAPIDTIKSIVLDPAQLRSVAAAVALARRADSVSRLVEEGYAAVRLRETLDTAQALVTRLRGTNRSALGLPSVRAAVADVQRVSAQIDTARRRAEALERTVRSGAAALEAGVRAIEDARRDDYELARGLLKLPSFEPPQIGAALFGRVSLDKFEQALYWTALARQYAPPGLLPRESTGPRRLRRAGTTVRFVRREAYPRLLVRRAEVDLSVGGSSAARGAYAAAVADATTEPAIVGRPTRFTVRREAAGSAVGSLGVTGLLDHSGARPRDVVGVVASGARLPTIALPALPLRAEPGRGTSELQLILDGDHLSARWALRSGQLTWLRDSARARELNAVESLVARVITGVREFDLSAELSGPLQSPALAVRSNLDRVVAARLAAVAGQEVERAMARARAQVDKIVEEKSAPARARVTELRARAEHRVADAKARLDEEKRKLDAQLKTLTRGMVGLPGGSL